MTLSTTRSYQSMYQSIWVLEYDFVQQIPGRNRGQEWKWSTQQASSMYQMHVTSLLSTPLPLWTSIITLGKKIDDKKTFFL